jgi:hypothetical protein
MAKSFVNLDALIPREDFQVTTTDDFPPSDLGSSMKVTELDANGFTYRVIRKPDFQRETANWEPEKVAELVRSFLTGDLIPAIILWRSPKSGNIFVIDGAHRLSALIAWVHDDYGDRDTSLRFFGRNIPREQEKAAQQTRLLVNQSVGTYEDLRRALQNPDTASPDKLRLAKNLSAGWITLQWVRGEAEKAESSFFKINQQGTPIDKTELAMIQARRKPNAVAARAFIRAGTGHKYWSYYEKTVQEEIEQIADEVYELLFNPTLESTVKSTDLPAAGRGYSADSLRMILEFVNYVNKIEPDMWLENSDIRVGKINSGKESIPNDADGLTTLKFMRSVRKVAVRIAGKDVASLALHPAVYFYSATGLFQPAAFLATVQFTTELADRNELLEFTSTRYRFEEFLVEFKYFINQVAKKFGGIPRSVKPMLAMFHRILEGAIDGATNEEIVSSLRSQRDFRELKITTEEDRLHGKNFSRETKNTIYLGEILRTASRCAICSARLQLKQSSLDHVTRREDGGMGSPDNGQITHPYCNSGYKEYRHSQIYEHRS